jgi:hypothetical protein
MFIQAAELFSQHGEIQNAAKCFVSAEEPRRAAKMFARLEALFALMILQRLVLCLLTSGVDRSGFLLCAVRRLGRRGRGVH